MQSMGAIRAQIRKHDRHHPPFSADLQVGAVGEDLLGDFVRQIAAEGLPDQIVPLAELFLQPGDLRPGFLQFSAFLSAHKTIVSPSLA